MLEKLKKTPQVIFVLLLWLSFVAKSAYAFLSYGNQYSYQIGYYLSKGQVVVALFFAGAIITGLFQVLLKVTYSISRSIFMRQLSKRGYDYEEMPVSPDNYNLTVTLAVAAANMLVAPLNFVYFSYPYTYGMISAIAAPAAAGAALLAGFVFLRKELIPDRLAAAAFTALILPFAVITLLM